jgi:hypothetical protein
MRDPNSYPQPNASKRETAKHSRTFTGRRKFLGKVGSITAAAMVSSLTGQPSLLGSPHGRVLAQEEEQLAEAGSARGGRRAKQAYKLRVEAARQQKADAQPDHPTNGDEGLYANRIGSYSKGLPHNHLGEVDPLAYHSLFTALTTGEPADFESIRLGLGRKLTNPQAGLAFEMQGPDAQALLLKPAPAFSSAEEAGEIAENYWMALLRDVPFSEYNSNPLTLAAAADLSRLSEFRGPKINGQVTPDTLFRGSSAGDVRGPYISQFMWLNTPFGAEAINRQMRTTIAGRDYMTDYAEWLAVQNGSTALSDQYDPTPRYIRNGRDLGEWVHIDVLFQAYFNAFLILTSLNAPLDAGNPYNRSRTQIGFGTLGGPYMASVLCGVARVALKAVWFQKWFVHRRLRPEAFAGRLQNHLSGATRYPIHADILNSSVLDELFSRNGGYLLPMAYPEGSPTHPAYGAGHATVAGACVTILKAFFDESFIIPDPVEASADGLSLASYGGQLRVGDELNKLAANVAMGRNLAGVHWRSDAAESLRLGEEIAIRYLRDERHCFNEPFSGFSLTRFDGEKIII